MFLEIKALLTADEIARLNTLARGLTFVDGRLSNPDNQTKHNLQADVGDPRYVEAAQTVLNAIVRNREFNDYALPLRISPPVLARYEPGMKYGVHADVAHMRLPKGILRADLSCTVFIAEPSAYDGGELTIHMGSRAVQFKGDAGDAIVYPSTTLHEVRPVTAGERLVSVTFIESMIAEEHKRDMVYELLAVSQREGRNMQWENRVKLEAVRQNLLRIWS